MSIKIVHRTLPPLQHWEGLLIPVHISDGSRGGARGARPLRYFLTKLKPEGPKKVLGDPSLISRSGSETAHAHARWPLWSELFWYQEPMLWLCKTYRWFCWLIKIFTNVQNKTEGKFPLFVIVSTNRYQNLNRRIKRHLNGFRREKTVKKRTPHKESYFNPLFVQNGI